MEGKRMTAEKEKENTGEKEKENTGETKPGEKKTNTKENTPVWAKQLDQSIQNLAKQLAPETKKADPVEIPVPKKPQTQDQKEEDQEKTNPPEQKKRSFLEWLM
jgi:hypothetical protein